MNTAVRTKDLVFGNVTVYSSDLTPLHLLYIRYNVTVGYVHRNSFDTEEIWITLLD
jgi:hypothetical protein